MTRRRVWVIVLGLGALVWALGGEWMSIHHGVTENHLLDGLAGLSFFGAGIIALDRRPGNPIGPLMLATATVWFFGNWGNVGWPVVVSLGFVGGELGTPFLVNIFLVYPSGHLRSGFDRVLLWIVYGMTIATSLVIVLTWDPSAFGCECLIQTHAPFPNQAVFEATQRVVDLAPIVLVPMFVASLVLRWRRASRVERRDLWPLWLAGFVLSLVYLIGAFASPDYRDPFAYLLWEIRSILQISVPIIFVWGLLSTRLARSAVGDLVMELETPVPPGGLRDALARALGDPSLDVVYAMDGERWVDAEGRAAESPTQRAGGDRRTVTFVESEGERLAAVVHDPALDAGLVRAANAAAGLAIANERLRAQVRAQLEEVRASRQRIVEAGDQERRRVERNLHDGAQQRLVTTSLGLALLRQRDDLDPATVAAIDQATAELAAAMRELRELARGIHPAILTEEGLGAAVESVVDRSSVPVHLRIELDGRLPEPIEATAYFVVSEALANVAKYAQATSIHVDVARRNGALHVQIADDGRGGADVGAGSGLRGLEDRVAAVGGELRVESATGSGTKVLAEIPCDA